MKFRLLQFCFCLCWFLNDIHCKYLNRKANCGLSQFVSLCHARKYTKCKWLLVINYHTLQCRKHILKFYTIFGGKSKVKECWSFKNKNVEKINVIFCEQCKPDLSFISRSPLTCFSFCSSMS